MSLFAFSIAPLVETAFNNVGGETSLSNLAELYNEIPFAPKVNYFIDSSNESGLIEFLAKKFVDGAFLLLN